MRVVYLCAKHPPLDGRVHFKISPCIVKYGHELINIHPNIAEKQNDGFTLVGYPQTFGFKGRLRSLRALYQTGLRQNPDAILAPEPDSLLIAYLIKQKNRNIKVIFDCHEWYNVHYTHVARMKNQTVAKLMNKAVTVMMQYISKRIDAVITVNDTMTEYFSRFNKKCFTIPSLMDQDFIPDMSIQRKYYIYFGQFGNGGQEEILLRAARILKQQGSNAKILVIGGFRNTDSPAFRDFASKIEQEKMSSQIELKPWMPREKSFLLLNSGLAGIMRFDISYYDGLPALPNKIFEYMSLGMAIIGCRQNKDIDRIINNEQCGFSIRNETGEDLAEAIQYMENNPEICRQMGLNALQAVKNKYNWIVYGRLLNKVLLGQE